MIRITIDHEPFSYNGRIRVQDVRCDAGTNEYPIPHSMRRFEGDGAIDRATEYATKRMYEWRAACQTAEVHDKTKED